jgi:hypothetical protein
LTEDNIRASVGFRCIDTNKNHLKALYQDTFLLDSFPADAILDVGDLATLNGFSNMTYIYPLQNLTSDIPRQLEAFFAHIHMFPKQLVSDFHTKLIWGKAHDCLNYVFKLQP